MSGQGRNEAERDDQNGRGQNGQGGQARGRSGQGLRVSLSLARRELRGGLRGFRVFLACLILGVAAISAVGIVRGAIHAGLEDQGAVLLGGDARMKFTYRYASEEERAFMAARATAIAEVVDFRSMAVVGEGETSERALTQVKAVDQHWPLLGQAELDPPQSVAAALAPREGVPGAVMDRVLAERLGLRQGDRFLLGLQSFELSALLTREPDNTAAGFGFGPRTLVYSRDLAQSGLIGPGTLFETEYRLLLPPETDLAALKAEALERFRDTGMRWQDRSRAAPGVEQFVERMASFLVLVGLAGLAVGGVGISAAVRAYLDGKTATIATLKTLGASQRVIFQTYLLQIGLLGLGGTLVGVILGAAVPLAAAPVLNALLPVPAVFRPYPAALLEAGVYGLLTALLFTIWPLARAARIRAAALYRAPAGAARGAPHPLWWGVTAGLAAALIGGAAFFTGQPRMAFGAAIGICGALAVLWGAALLLRALARRLARLGALQGRPALRLAVAAVGGPGQETLSVVLSLGLGLSVLAAVGQIDANLRQAIARDLPERAPSYFFVDIQNDQIEGFLAKLAADPQVGAVETAPMLRGVLTRINGRPASEVAGDHWVVRGDRGITYADAQPAGTTVVAGDWWPLGYDGPPLVSFARAEAEEIGVGLGDRITLNILGRDIEATIASLREVDFQTGGIGFVMSLSPNAVRGAPHTHIATVHAEEVAEGRVLREMAQAYPNITAIRIRDAVAQATEALDAIAKATAWAAGATLLTGFIVLIGAAAAGERGRIFEAAVLKTLGAGRGQILASFALRSALMGAAAGLVAVLAGALAGWAVMRFVMQVGYRFEPVSALAIVLGGILLVLVVGALFALRPLAARPARILRAEE